MQTDFKTYSEPVALGQIADSSLCQIDSYAAESDIKFGEVVKRGANPDKQVLPCDNITEFLGVAIRNDICRRDHYVVKEIVSVMTKGRVVVITTEAVKAGDIAYFHADGKINKKKANGNQEGKEIGVFTSSQSSPNQLVTLEIK